MSSRSEALRGSQADFPTHALSRACCTATRLQAATFTELVEKVVLQPGTFAKTSMPTAAIAWIVSVFSHDSDSCSPALAAPHRLALHAIETGTGKWFHRPGGGIHTTIDETQTPSTLTFHHN